jgi:hypothetical protein
LVLRHDEKHAGGFFSVLLLAEKKKLVLDEGREDREGVPAAGAGVLTTEDSANFAPTRKSGALYCF